MLLVLPVMVQLLLPPCLLEPYMVDEAEAAQDFAERYYATHFAVNSNDMCSTTTLNSRDVNHPPSVRLQP
ncbi:hypothetical protein WOLCODRAFT_145526 [Wolfiporia cocos MD-104 SS10]|uniref:Secreted protein n=1 Tax=Wolfiporia cocos (strain MD-104) TaxID=742152 RepID=A0A2H3JFR0_WOLCO|nr:hypothetical protein WOLCODRAFT_145526 [Wolfiporia cocos MD-104 SS10]